MKIYAASYVLPISAPPVQGGAIAVDGSRILAVGKLSDLCDKFAAPVEDYPGALIMPGLVNAHTHLELTHFPSWKIRLDLDYAPRTYVDWVIQVIKIKRGLDLHELQLSLNEGIRKSLEAGTTAVGDIISDYRLLPGAGASPLLFRVFLEALGQSEVACSNLAEKLENILSRPQQQSTVYGISPHATYTVSGGFFRQLSQVAQKYHVPTMTHISESLEETLFMGDGTGKIADTLYPFVHWEQYLPGPLHTTSVQHLDSLGVLQPSTLAVHCVHVTPADGELMKKRGVRVVLCPRSNEKLAVGKAPAHLFKTLGIPMALGTDSLASNDSLSLLDEMKYVLADTPNLFTAAELLRMATLGGAEALGIDRETGSLEEGKRADFILLDLPDGISEKNIYLAAIEEGRVTEVIAGGQPLSNLAFPLQNLSDLLP